MITCFFFSDQC